MTTRPKGSSINLKDINGLVSLADLGAAGTDITTALLVALTSGVGIYVPQGTWYISGISIPANSLIVGTGVNSILKLNNTANATALAVGNNCSLFDFTLDCNKINQVGSGLNGIDLSNSTRSRCRNVNVLNTKGSGFYLGGANADNELINCIVSGYTESGIRIAGGTNALISNPSIYSSDPAATGDGIAVVSSGLAISGLVIDAPKIKDVTGRGISCIGNGTKNITDVIISNPRIVSATSHALHTLLVEGVTVGGGYMKQCGGDGVRIEGDSQRCSVSNVIIRSNTGNALREVVNGSTPNFNNFTYNQLIANGVNTATKLGANSAVV